MVGDIELYLNVLFQGQLPCPGVALGPGLLLWVVAPWSLSCQAFVGLFGRPGVAGAAGLPHQLFLALPERVEGARTPGDLVPLIGEKDPMSWRRRDFLAGHLSSWALKVSLVPQGH